MNAPESPFLAEIADCRLIMRRLRKKISKYSSTREQAKKPRDQSHDIMNILKSRNLPSFVIDTIRKRRTFDFLCLKNIALSGESSLEEMVNLAGNQEAEIQSMFADHKLRFRKPYTSYKFERRSTGCSSTEVDEISDPNQQNSSKINGDQIYKSKIHQLNQEIEVSNFQMDNFQFSGRDFLSFQDQMYSEEEWLKF